MYIKIFIKIYKQHNCGLVYKTYKMAKFENYLTLKAKNSLNLNTYQL